MISSRKLNSRWLIICVLITLAAMTIAKPEQPSIDDSHVAIDATMDHIDDTRTNHTKMTAYEKELSQCPTTFSKIMFSLILRDQNWNDIIDTKCDRALNKLSKLFGVSKEFIVTNDVNERELTMMTNNAIRTSENQLNNRRQLGKLEFVIGCNGQYFTIGQTIANQIEAQLTDESTVNQISGLTFGYWAVWNKAVSSRTPRSKRESQDEQDVPADADDDDYYDEEDEAENVENDENAEELTEKPIKKVEIDEHPHRHHHGDDKLSKQNYDSNSQLKNAFDATESISDTVDRNIIDVVKLSASSSSSSSTPPVVMPAPPISREDVNQLESVITKTIENTNEQAVEQEIKKSINERKAATEKIISNDPNIASVDEFLPIVEVFSDDDAIEIKPKENLALPLPESDYVIEDNHSAAAAAGAASDTDNRRDEKEVSWPKKPTLSYVIDTDKEETTGKIADRIDDVTINSKVEKTTTPSTKPTQGRNPSLDDTYETTDAGDYDESLYDDYEEASSETPKASTTPSTQSRLLKEPGTTASSTSTEATTPSSTVTPTTSTTPSTTTQSTTTASPTVEVYVEPEIINNPPLIKSRLAKLAVTSGKPFNHIVPLDTFFDAEDGTNLKLELLDKYEKPLDAKSWIQFNPDTRDIYGLPLEDSVSKWQFKLRATDSSNESVVESLDISVQQHKSYRSVNHEIEIKVNLLERFSSNVDWEMRLIKGIVDTLGDGDATGVLVRDVQYGLDISSATFKYTNESLPKDKCPEDKLDELFQHLTVASLDKAVSPSMSIKSISGKPIGQCSLPETAKPAAPKPTQHMTKNHPPLRRNQVDRVNASIGQLLVFKVPQDTFYDQEDGTDLKLSLITYERHELDPKYWLQFDSKNHEFYGVPKYGDVGRREYVLVAEDREGMQATDALEVFVNHPPHREYSTAFEFTLNMPYEEFNNSAVQRRFIERIAQLFNDPTTDNILIRAIRPIHQTGTTYVTFFNTTLHRPHNVCPTDEVESLRRILVHKDGSIRPRIREIIGNEFNLTKINFAPTGPCLPGETKVKVHHASIPIAPNDNDVASFTEEYLLTILLPAGIILIMLLLTCLIACLLHRRRMTGKMELGDEEERKSFRSKGIPVIFQDELEEKPDIGNKSPIILKNEKPPLLPPSYNTTNPDDHEDMEDYIPPPAVVMSGRESRGKSPVTPSYRKPPPYVSP